MPPAQPSVTKLFNSQVFPDLAALGFKADGGKTFRRIVGDVCQSVFMHVETRIRREFMLEYSAFLICVPHTSNSLEHGGRFPVGSRGTWYGAHTPERLEQSMAKVRGSLPGLLDWFRASETLDGFLRTFATREMIFYGTGHPAMTQACAHAVLGDFAAAKQLAEQARSEFEQVLAKFREIYPKGPHWAPEYIERAGKLIAAIENSKTDTLLAEWRKLTRDALKLRV